MSSKTTAYRLPLRTTIAYIDNSDDDDNTDGNADNNNCDKGRFQVGSVDVENIIITIIANITANININIHTLDRLR